MSTDPAPASHRGPPAAVTGLSHDGRGIARLKGKTLFIEDALPGEEVIFRVLRRRKDYDEAEIREVVTASPVRVTPRCGHYGTCGGCALQHMDPEAQVAAKQQALLDNLQRIGGVEPREVLSPLTGPFWGYRRRARLAAHRSPAGRVFVGFTERHRHRVTDLHHCDVLDSRLAALLEPLSALFSRLSIADRVPQIEAVAGEDLVVLSLRVLSAPSVADREILAAFEREHHLRFYLQPGKSDSAQPLAGGAPDLHYRLPESGVDIGFLPTDFIQINGEVNRRLVELALAELDAQPGDRALDLFCGLGNFTLPLAQRVASVTGVEGEAGLVVRARGNAERNRIDNALFQQADLFAEEQEGAWARETYQRIVLDPPRAGAREIIARFPRFKAERIVYVSCHPATLARDARMLVEEQGYTLLKAGVLDMFPHTAHVESIAVFGRTP